MTCSGFQIRSKSTWIARNRSDRFYKRSDKFQIAPTEFLNECFSLWTRCGRNVIFFPHCFATCGGFAELIYFGVVVQLTLLQLLQFGRYDVTLYE